MRLHGLFVSIAFVLVACGGGSETSDEAPFDPASKDASGSTDDTGNR